MKTRAWTAIVLLVGGCGASAVPLYAGPELEEREVCEVSLPSVALTAVRDSTGNELISRHMKDARILLQPGRYQIEFFATAVVWSDLNFPIDTDLYTVDFTAEAGRKYVLKTQVVGVMSSGRRHLGDTRQRVDEGMCCDPTATDVYSSLVDETNHRTVGKGVLVEIDDHGARVHPVGPPGPPNKALQLTGPR